MGVVVQALCITWCSFSELRLSGSFPMILTYQPQCDWLLGSRLCANRDGGINPNGHTPPIRSPIKSFQMHPGLYLCHKPFRGWDIISLMNLFPQSLGCHRPILPPGSHPVRFRGWGRHLPQMDRHWGGNVIGQLTPQEKHRSNPRRELSRKLSDQASSMGRFLGYKEKRDWGEPGYWGREGWAGRIREDGGWLGPCISKDMFLLPSLRTKSPMINPFLGYTQ